MATDQKKETALPGSITLSVDFGNSPDRFRQTLRRIITVSSSGRFTLTIPFGSVNEFARELGPEDFTSGWKPSQASKKGGSETWTLTDRVACYLIDNLIAIGGPHMEQEFREDIARVEYHSSAREGTRYPITMNFENIPSLPRD